MKRIYQDINGKMKTIIRRGPGKPMKWREDLPVSATTVWADPETKKNYRIPDDAWQEMQIQFVDLKEGG